MTELEEEMYKENILEHYKRPQNFGALVPHTHSEKGVNPSCGDVFVVYARIEGETLQDISFEGEGCAISTAGASMLSEKVKEKKIEDIKRMKEKEVYDLLGVSISVGREKCALLFYNTLQKIIS